MFGFRGLGRIQIVTVAVALSTVFAACQKKRAPDFIQGDGEYIYKISDFDGRKYSLETGEKLAPATASDADEVVLDEGNAVLRSFNAVEYESDIELTTISSDLYNDLSFFGKENADVETYQTQLGFTENHLVVYKLAKKQDIPSNEMTYAIAAGDEYYKVPMLGYPLSKYTIEYVEDSRGKKTKQKRSIRKDFLDEATHFSIDTTRPKYFDSEEKINLLPTSFFNESNEWFFEITLVDGPLSTQLGAQLGSGKARFTRTSNSLMAVDVNIPEEAETLSGEKLPRILQLPVRWVDFKLAQTGSSALLEEQLLDEKDAGAVDWQEREYGLFDFRRINNLDSANANSIRVKRLEVDDDYFSVTIASSDSGYAIHYSFSRDNQQIPGLAYPTLDRKKFGFWRNLKSFYPGELTITEKNVEENVSIGRMYPENRVIEVYLTDNTPEIPEFMESIDAAIHAWDEAFVEASKGTKWENDPIRVKLNRDMKVKNGDVRYNKISFYDFNINVGGLLGYGPSVTDPRNGQIFSSTNHIYLRTYREGVYRDLKNYIRWQLGLFDDKRVDGIEFPNQILRNTTNIATDFDTDSSASLGMFARQMMTPIKRAELDALAGDIQLDGIRSKSFEDSIQKAEALMSQLKSPYGNVDFVPKSLRENFESRLDPSREFMANSSSCSFKASVANTFEEIKTTCGNLKFADYVEELKQLGSSIQLEQLEFPAEVFDECAMKLLAPTLRSTLVHEFGHNLGLTHNFMGSADDDNFMRDENGIPLSRSTSVMDYPDRDEDRGFAPGAYDIAAIRYGYYQAVELAEKDASGDHKIVSIASSNPRDTRPIEERVEDPSKLRNYLYCWDLDIGPAQIPNEDPKCRRWDRGSNPVQMVFSLIDRFDGIAAINMHRYDSVQLGSPANYAWTQVILPMQSIYTKFRHMLYLKTKSLNDPYFVKNEPRFEQFIETYVFDGAENVVTVAELPKDDLKLEAFVEALPEIQQYKLASDLIFKFLTELSFADDKYCNVWEKAENDQFEIVATYPFAKLRSKIFNQLRDQGGLTVNSCQEAAPFIAKGEQKVSEYGTPFADVSFSANDEILPVKDDITVGIGMLRLYAFEGLTSRLAPLGIAWTNGFEPSFMDDPGYRAKLIEEFELRLGQGIDTSKFAGDQRNIRFIEQFSEESSLISAMYPNLLSSIYAPGENVVSRIKELRPDFYNRADFQRIFPNPVEAGIAYVRSVEGNYYVSEDPNSPIYRLIKRFEEVQSLIELTTTAEFLEREQDQVTESLVRIQQAFLEDFNQAPELDANAIQFAAVEAAAKVLTAEFVKVEVDSIDEALGNEVEPAATLDLTEDELVRSFVELGRTYLQTATASGFNPSAGDIRDILLEITGTVDIQPDVFASLLQVLKPDEFRYFNLAYDSVLGALAASQQQGELSEETLKSLAATSYAQYIGYLKSEALDNEAFSEKGAQESILRSVILR